MVKEDLGCVKSAKIYFFNMIMASTRIIAEAGINHDGIFEKRQNN